MPLRPMAWPFVTVSPTFTLDRREVRVERLHAEAVVDDDAVAVDAEERRVHDLAVVRRDDFGTDDVTARSKPRWTC